MDSFELSRIKLACCAFTVSPNAKMDDLQIGKIKLAYYALGHLKNHFEIRLLSLGDEAYQQLAWIFT